MVPFRMYDACIPKYASKIFCVAFSKCLNSPYLNLTIEFKKIGIENSGGENILFLIGSPWNADSLSIVTFFFALSLMQNF